MKGDGPGSACTSVPQHVHFFCNAAILQGLFIDGHVNALCRFKKEQSSALASPAPATYTEPSSIQEYSAPTKAAASLGQLAFGVSHARGTQ